MACDESYTEFEGYTKNSNNTLFIKKLLEKLIFNMSLY
jgi:hypothetical protein